MPPRKPTKKPSKSRPSGSGTPRLLVYGVGLGLVLSFTWVIWPYIADFLPTTSREKAEQRMEREHPDAEVFTLPNSLKKNP